MLKKLTRAVAHIVSSDTLPRTVDASFDRAKANWSILNNVLLDVRKQIEQYRTSMRGLCTASSAAHEAIALLFPQPSTSGVSVSASGTVSGAVPAAPATNSHPYSSLAHSSKARLQSLLQGRFEECERRLTHSCLASCLELLDKFASLRTRLAEREEALEELEHYANKTAGLRRDRDKLLTQGRKETPKEEERRARNEDSTLKLRANFTELNSALTSELTAYWDSRLNLLTPIMLDFHTCQAKFAAELTECASDIGRLREQTLKTAPAIDFGTVLFEITTAADYPERQKARRYSESESRSSSGPSNGYRTEQNSPTLSSTPATFLPPPLPIPATPPAPATSPPSSAVPPPLPVAALAIPSSSSSSPAPSPKSAPRPIPPPATPSPHANTQIMPPAVPARPTLPLRKHAATMQFPLQPPSTSGSPAPDLGPGPRPPPPLPPAGPSVAARMAAAGPLPPHPAPPPPPAAASSGSVVAASSSSSSPSATAAAALDASYDRALRSVAAPQFVVPSRGAGPPPLPPTSCDPEPWSKSVAGHFGQMHAQAEAELECFGVPKSPLCTTAASSSATAQA